MKFGNLDLSDGDEFGCLILGNADVRGDLSDKLELDGGVWVVKGNPFPLDAGFRERLGSFLVDDLNKATLAICVVASQGDSVTGGLAHARPIDIAYHYFRTMQFQGVPRASKPFGLSGVIKEERPQIAQWSHYQPFRYNSNQKAVRISAKLLGQCKPLVDGLRAVESAKRAKTHWRVFYGLHVLFDALREFYIDDRLLQLVRSLDAILKTPQGAGKREFVRRMGHVVLACGRTKTALEEVYDLRNASAHMHDWAMLLSPKYPRSHKRVAAKRALGVELLALHVWRRILQTPSLLSALASDAAIDAFWKQPHKLLRQAWGKPFPLQKAVKEAYFAHDE